MLQMAIGVEVLLTSRSLSVGGGIARGVRGAASLGRLGDGGMGSFATYVLGLGWRGGLSGGGEARLMAAGHLRVDVMAVQCGVLRLFC